MAVTSRLLSLPGAYSPFLFCCGQLLIFIHLPPSNKRLLLSHLVAGVTDFFSGKKCYAPNLRKVAPDGIVDSPDER
ncbi:hypothetical protein H6P81_019350 [Aristolochia fimbriata]|uniref:Secreted protein n=1 Tax=Aristolochia fimbriata TaxID=158543 RepID=A0AAV7DRJ8_ARIFI|nr:hypothetical protein H6P81_019350 [Aristolochia fimbriata]